MKDNNRTAQPMTTTARNRNKQLGRAEVIKIGVWNPRGLSNKEIELQKELENMKVDVAIIPETKKKLKGSYELDKYTIIYHGVPQEKRAAAGIAILTNKIWTKKIHSYEFINERIIKARFRIQRGYMTIIGVYSPEEGRVEETEQFYDNLQKVIDKTNANDYIVIAGDLNARVGNKPIKK